MPNICNEPLITLRGNDLIGNRIEANRDSEPEPFGFYFCVVHAKKSRLYQTLCSVEPALFDSEYGSVDSSKWPAEDGLTPHCRVRAVLILAAKPGVYDSQTCVRTSDFFRKMMLHVSAART